MIATVANKQNSSLSGAALACAVCGGQARLARALNEAGVRISAQAVQQWVANGNAVPPRKVLAVSHVTHIPPAKLNPAVFDAYQRE